MLLKTFGVATISRWGILSDYICVTRVFTKSHSYPKFYCIIPYKLCESSTAQIKFWYIKVVMCDSFVPAKAKVRKADQTIVLKWQWNLRKKLSKQWNNLALLNINKIIAKAFCINTSLMLPLYIKQNLNKSDRHWGSNGKNQTLGTGS